MAVSLESSPICLLKNQSPSMNSSSSPLLSPTSDKEFWSALRNRVDTLLENRKLDYAFTATDQVSGVADIENSKRLKKEDCLLLLRGFDSISSSLSQLTGNLDTAVNGARELAKSSFTEAFQSDIGEPAGDEKEENKRGVKRKTSSDESSLDGENHEQKETAQSLKIGKLKKAKNLAFSLATKAATLARELKSVKSDLCFMQDRCSMLEEENRRLREGYAKGTRPEEDDLVRLQLEALLAEKFRLANENANLTRENECLHQLVEYHQHTSQGLSTSYEQFINGTCLDFSSPTPTIDEEYDDEEYGDKEAPVTPRTDMHGLSTSLDGWLRDEQQR